MANFGIANLHIPHPEFPDDYRARENWQAIERWATLQLHGKRPVLHIPHKDWANNFLEHENYSAIERWARQFNRAVRLPSHGSVKVRGRGSIDGGGGNIVVHPSSMGLSSVASTDLLVACLVTNGAVTGPGWSNPFGGAGIIYFTTGAGFTNPSTWVITGATYSVMIVECLSGVVFAGGNATLIDAGNNKGSTNSPTNVTPGKYGMVGFVRGDASHFYEVDRPYSLDFSVGVSTSLLELANVYPVPSVDLGFTFSFSPPLWSPLYDPPATPPSLIAGISSVLYRATSATIGSNNFSSLHIPHKDWADNQNELENYLAIERWVPDFQNQFNPF